LLIDEASVATREQTIGNGGVMPGRELAFVFSTLRGNDLIWPYVVGNYLEGRQPDAFDILYWNADCTNLPGPMYCWYVRNTYLENNLRIPGKTVQCDLPVDLGKIDVPTYVLASREDHIVPWQTAYRTTKLIKGDARFTLAASGHIAGVINPASRNKRSYWIDGSLGKEAEQWLSGAHEVTGNGEGRPCRMPGLRDGMPQARRQASGLQGVRRGLRGLGRDLWREHSAESENACSARSNRNPAYVRFVFLPLIHVVLRYCPRLAAAQNQLDFVFDLALISCCLCADEVIAAAERAGESSRSS